MKRRQGYILALWITLLTIALAACSQGVVPPPAPSMGNSPPGVQATTSPPSAPLPTATPPLKKATYEPSRASEAGGIAVEVKLEPRPSIGAQQLTFEIAVDTHSGNLNYNLARLALLRDDKGRQWNPATWGGGSGGHHISGRLTFSSNQPIVQPDTLYLELILNNIGQVPQRVLRWELAQP